jgi:hypothetical protein
LQRAPAAREAVASHTVRPTLDLAAGRQVLDQDLPQALALYGVATPEALGWRVHGNRSLLVPIKAIHGEIVDDYLLRLDFVTGRDWPPRAQFVNPSSLTYVVGKDTGHLPRLNHPEVNVHPAYQSATGASAAQLICCSATFEYYDVLHGGDDAILWQDCDSFMVTLAAIRRGLATPHYEGRYPADEA